jgi:hypothetical protein
MRRTGGCPNRSSSDERLNRSVWPLRLGCPDWMHWIAIPRPLAHSAKASSRNAGSLSALRASLKKRAHCNPWDMRRTHRRDGEPPWSFPVVSSLSYAALAQPLTWAQNAAAASARGMDPISASSRLVLYHCTESAPSHTTSSRPRFWERDRLESWVTLDRSWSIPRGRQHAHIHSGGEARRTSAHD